MYELNKLEQTHYWQKAGDFRLWTKVNIFGLDFMPKALQSEALRSWARNLRVVFFAW